MSVQFSALLDSFFYRPDEPTPPVLAWVDEAAVPPPSVDAAPHELLVFGLAEETYAVPIESVREIVKVPVLTEVPRAAPGLLGVMSLRGEVLPVYDVKLRLKLVDVIAPVTGPNDVWRSSRIVVVRDVRGDAGLLVDSVQQVLRLKASLIEAPPPGGAEPQCIDGVARLAEQLIILLNTERLLP